MHGVRFFDIRVGHYPGTEEKYYINHDVTRIRPLMTFFSDVKSFVEETNEVVLIDMHRFPVGFEDEGGHEEFIDFIENEIGSLLYLESAGRNPTLNQVRGAGKSIILSYGEYQYSNQHDFLWPSVYHVCTHYLRQNFSRMDRVQRETLIIFTFTGLGKCE
jgi:hypothetical protein